MKGLKNSNSALNEEVKEMKDKLATWAGQSGMLSPNGSQESMGTTAAANTWSRAPQSVRSAGGVHKMAERSTQARQCDPITIDFKNTEAQDGVKDTRGVKKAMEEAPAQVEGTKGVVIRNLRAWNTKDGKRIVKFTVNKEQEDSIRSNATLWLEKALPGARLLAEKWYPVRVDYIEVSLATADGNPGITNSAMERFGTDNKVVVRSMRWMTKVTPTKQHASAVVKVATKEEADRLIAHGCAQFGGECPVVPFDESRGTRACFSCNKMGHKSWQCPQKVVEDGEIGVAGEGDGMQEIRTQQDSPW